jgi:hypothetical protein
LLDDDWSLGKRLYRSEADAILALVRAHMTSDETVERMLIDWVNQPPLGNIYNAFRAAILAALGDTHD